ncbi:MAG: hypothetical protein II839_00175 [Kiritimatiellae bacterium]|nr:hypothetical protein [Kiritimatiellia bacterium]
MPISAKPRDGSAGVDVDHGGPASAGRTVVGVGVAQKGSLSEAPAADDARRTVAEWKAEPA